MKKILPRNLEIKGIGVSDGIVIGRTYILTDEKAVPHRRTISDEQITIEKNKFEQAIENTKKELVHIKDDILRKESLKEHINIIKAHISILEDKLILNETFKIIEKDRFNAEWAFAIVMDRFIKHFDKVADPYIRERKVDLEHMKDRVIKNLLGQSFRDVSKIKTNVILVAFDLSPAETARLNTERVKGIVTEMGSKTSHTAIIAKALNIPAIVAADTVISQVTGGDLLIVDGNNGVVIINPDETVVEKYLALQRYEEQKKKILLEYAKLPSKTAEGIAIKVEANIELPEEVTQVKEFGASGVGLYRTEFLFLNRETPPTEDEHFAIYQEVARNVYPDNVTIRTFDLGGDKVGYHHQKLAEKNPALGLRAIRFCLAEKKIFKDQIKGILRASEAKNVKILFPLLSSLSEIKTIKTIIKDAKKELDDRNLKYDKNIKIGIMIEVPSAVVISDMLAKEVDFFSIGTNDLIQYTLAIDRSNEYVAHFYDPLNLAIIRMLDTVLNAAQANNIDVSICGEMAGEPKYIPLLIGMGYRELSMNPVSLPIAKKVIGTLHVEKIKEIVEQYRSRQFVGIETMMKKIEDVSNFEQGH